MGRARIGGTRAKLRGAVGSDIYQIVHAADGSLEQYVYSRPAGRAYSNTDKQIRNRMIMGQIERMFHILPSIISGGFFNVDSGSMSFQRFAKLNYPLLREDFENHFDDGNVFDWRSKRDVTAPAGVWLLTDGNLTPPNYDRVLASVDERNGIYFYVGEFDGAQPVSDIFTKMNVIAGDSLVLFLFRKDSPNYVPWVQQVIFKVSDDIDPDARIEDTFENEIIIPANPDISFAQWDVNRHDFTISFEDANAAEPYRALCVSLMVVRSVGTKTLFSPAKFIWVDQFTSYKYPKQTPANAWGSWAQM